jgi:hypothetical protein
MSLLYGTLSHKKREPYHLTNPFEKSWRRDSPLTTPTVPGHGQKFAVICTGVVRKGPPSLSVVFIQPPNPALVRDNACALQVNAIP